ncbi:LETM1 domain-containing protein [Citrus sinensis]|uniref:LETM1 domain-containing protein n=1 Tax=Citrus sinensis TaxID=2711 RepID=A0ACB8JAB8_CITSI|nr:LETM1 domain-containing protein [Citrus sinensis]
MLSRQGQWNRSGDLCTGAAIDDSIVFDNPNYNPFIKCDCSSQNGIVCHITQLKVYVLNVVGVIPDELWNLTSLFNLQSFGSEIRRNINTNVLNSSGFNGKEQDKYLFSKNKSSFKFLFKYYTTSSHVSLKAFSSTTTSASDQASNESDSPITEAEGDEMEFNRVNCLVWVLHESAGSFSHAIESLELPGSGAELAMAWNGKDVHEWHRRIAYRVAVYALLKMAIEVENLLSQDRHNIHAPVKEMIFQFFIKEVVYRIRRKEFKLNRKTFSGVAGIIVAISCCVAIGKLGPGRISCPMFKMSIEDASIELMNISYSFVSVDKLHQLATEAGFEPDFLSHFGKKVLPCNNVEELEFWIGLAQKKLLVAFHRESVLLETKTLHEKVQADSLVTLGLFAYLGRKTRKFLSSKGINDLDEMLKDFLSYLECGSLFIYPEFSSISVYQLFMEVVTDEIGWLDFYAAFPSFCNQERRSKHHAIQAEKEIILSNVFTVCYDVFSGFAHFTRSAQQPLEAELLAFLLRRWVVIAFLLMFSSSGLLKNSETGSSDRIPSLGTKSTSRFSAALEAKEKPTELVTRGNTNNKSQHPFNLRKVRLTGNDSSCQDSSSAGGDAITFVEGTNAAKSNAQQEGLIKKYSIKLMSTSMLEGHKITERERRKIKRTVNDITTLIPITILMLLPVSAVGHAAMLAAIKRYMPSMIPSPYSTERLDVVKQLERTKKMEVKSWGSLEDPPTMP